MVITYGTRTLFKREGAWGHAICKNCGHDAPQTLCRQLDQVTLFFIPIVSLEKTTRHPVRKLRHDCTPRQGRIQTPP